MWYIDEEVLSNYERQESCRDIRHWKDPFATGCDWWRLPIGEHLKNYPDAYLLNDLESLYVPAIYDVRFDFQSLNNGYRAQGACCGIKDAPFHGGINITMNLTDIESEETLCIGEFLHNLL